MLLYAVLSLRDVPPPGPPSTASGEPVKRTPCLSGVEKRLTNVRGENKLRVGKLLAIREPDWEDLWAAGRI